MQRPRPAAARPVAPGAPPPDDPGGPLGPLEGEARGVVPADRRRSVARTLFVLVGCAVLGASIAWAYVEREWLRSTVGPWWLAAMVPAGLALALVAPRPRPPKSAAHPALMVRRSQHWAFVPVTRPLGWRSAVPNVFVDGDSFAAAAWPGAGFAKSRPWSVDASARVAARFASPVAVVFGEGARDLPQRERVDVRTVPPGRTMGDVLWELIAPVDPALPLLFVTDDPAAARVAEAHGARVLSCRGWMHLVGR
jgi:hypothetical protein